MKKTLIVFSLSLCSALTVIAGEPGQSSAASESIYNEKPTLPFYISANPGVTWIQDVSFNDSGGGDSGTIKFHPGARLDFVFGYNLNQALAVEFETGMIFINSSSVRVNGSGVVTDERLSQFPFMANLRYQFPVHSRFHPFVGVGLGGAYTTVDEDEEFLFGSTTVGHDFTFGYQAFAGVRYELVRHFELGLEYKFMGTTAHDLGSLHLDPTFSHSLAFMLYVPF